MVSVSMASGLGDWRVGGNLPFLHKILAHAENSQLKVDSSLNLTYGISVCNFGYHTPHKIRRGAVAYEVDFI